MDYKLTNLFGKERRAEDFRAVENMNAEIQKVGGLLHFTVTQYKDGWTAQCDEIEGIMTGGVNPNPSNEEIRSNIREAIHTAFHIPTIATEKTRGIYNMEEVQAVYSRSQKEVAV